MLTEDRAATLPLIANDSTHRGVEVEEMSSTMRLSVRFREVFETGLRTLCEAKTYIGWNTEPDFSIRTGLV